jgi:hypothetical protein
VRVVTDEAISQVCSFDQTWGAGWSTINCRNDWRADMSTLLIVVLVLFLLGGGGWGYSRWRN